MICLIFAKGSRLNIGRKKMIKKSLDHLIDMQYGDSESLNFNNNTFDAITAGFGVRNFENLDKGLKEIYRVMKVGGKVAILEPSEPKIFPFKQFYGLYFKIILPILPKIELIKSLAILDLLVQFLFTIFKMISNIICKIKFII